MKTNANDLAYPFQDHSGLVQPSYGLTKREYFAVMVCAGLSPMCIPGSHNTTQAMVKELPQKAVAIADALIEELNRTAEVNK